MTTDTTWLVPVLTFLSGEGGTQDFVAAAGAFVMKIKATCTPREQRDEAHMYGIASLVGITLLGLRSRDVDTWDLFLREHVGYADIAKFEAFRKIAPAASPATKRFDDLVVRSRASVPPPARRESLPARASTPAPVRTDASRVVHRTVRTYA